jgi:hypothetical protein
VNYIAPGDECQCKTPRTLGKLTWVRFFNNQNEMSGIDQDKRHGAVAQRRAGTGDILVEFRAG